MGRDVPLHARRTRARLLVGNADHAPEYDARQSGRRREEHRERGFPHRDEIDGRCRSNGENDLWRLQRCAHECASVDGLDCRAHDGDQVTAKVGKRFQ
jgi:hypothetical protein